jgi:type II secretory ATPase GspE/PulE/Tfp pilus assembly ATPase PilB-like protein
MQMDPKVQAINWAPPLDGQDATAAVEWLLQFATRHQASDVHLHMDRDGCRVQFRLDGVLTHVGTLPAEAAKLILGRVKYLAKLKTYVESLPQDGRIAGDEVGLFSDVRVSTYPTVTGEKLVLRLFYAEHQLTLNQLGFPAGVSEALEHQLSIRSGMILLTGPAGSGKTTTIYALLQRLLETDSCHVITVEDPVERVIPGIMQTEINLERGLTFAKALKHLLRQDPQVLVIGEIRDEETASIALRASMTGHLVIATLHAGSCRGVVERLNALSDDSNLVASQLRLILNQRLVRKLCASCSGKGCASCFGSGLRGRVPFLEMLHLNEANQGAIETKRLARLVPDLSFEQSRDDLLGQALTTEAEINRHLQL